MKLNLSVKKIYEKEFKTKLKGYDPEEVDEFLNLIIEDYEVIAQYISECKETNQRLRDENYKLKKDLMNQSDSSLSKRDSIDLIQEKEVEDNVETRRLEELETKMDRMEKILLNLENKL